MLIACNIQASSGRIGSCLNGPAGQPIDPYRKLASDWDLCATNSTSARRTPRPDRHPIDLPVTISNDDVRDVDLGNGAVLDLAQVKVVRTAAGMPPTTSHDPQLRQMSADIAALQSPGGRLHDLRPQARHHVPAEGFTLAAIQFCESLRSIQAARRQLGRGRFAERRLQFRSRASK